DEGSGIVHTAVMYGEDDFRLGSEVGLPKHHTVDLEGKFTKDVPEFAAQFVKDPKTERAIIADLAGRGLLLKEEPYTHTYPFCWRCKTPLLYYAKRSWFIRMSALRDQLIERNGTVTWVPEHLKEGRFGEWLREVKDWALSRDRYWGTPLPIWHCTACDHKLCIGNPEELEQHAGQPAPKDLHRPYIDDVRWECTECSNGTMERYPEVIDVWFDSGAMPIAQWHYPYAAGSEQALEQHYPADYIAEGLDQTRGWFYTLLAVATALDRLAPYQSIISHGLVLDTHGKKMSKSVGNVVNPWEAIDRFGVDPIRFFFYSVNQPGEDKRFDAHDIEQVVRKVFLILWNVYRFAVDRGEVEARPGTTHVLDRWLVTRGSQVTKRVTDALDALDLFRASRELITWINELSTWYLRLSRKREDEDFLPTLAWALKRTALLMAPITPFFAELLWTKLRNESDPDSVHLADWPELVVVDASILTSMAAVHEVVELGRARRAEAKLKVRQPLARATVRGIKLSPELSRLLVDELNVKQVEQRNGKEISVELDTVLTDELKREGQVREVIRAVQQLRKQLGLNIDDQAQLELRGTGSQELLHATAIIETATRSTIVSEPLAADALTATIDGLVIRVSA
ncbi:class I tRNA ligase family protein, partial [Candidatus Berkelbacteria bacterium]|nr:class I tRNA ligase family protein [Candidatus Berkelbacteria bacterium]